MILLVSTFIMWRCAAK